MTQPVTYLEINSPGLDRSLVFFAGGFGWQLQPFADPGYLVAPGGDGPGIEHGGTVVLEPFAIPGVGRGCSAVDPAGVLIGLHEYDPDAR
jgi:predicted enzyme related to lactoylglutathione lyase